MGATKSVATAFTSKVVSFRVIKESDKGSAESPAESTAVVMDDDPRFKRIPKRPEGYLAANSCKMVYRVDNERKVLYFVVSFMPITGVLGGKEVRLERPVEVFIPPGQRTNDQEWIAALMRNLSLHARNGTLPEALADLRDVVSTNGPVHLEWTPTGKQKFHDSTVAAFASMVQALLIGKGYLDEFGRLNPVEKIVAAQAAPHQSEMTGEDETPVMESTDLSVDDVNNSVTAAHAPYGLCKDKLTDGSPCGGVLKFSEGCLVCIGCGASKCS